MSKFRQKPKPVDAIQFTDWIVKYGDWVFVINNDLFERLYERVN